MCGIFGISAISNEKLIFEDLIKDIDFYVSSSEKRGSDTFGICFKTDKNFILYKAKEKPSNAIKRKNYKIFLEKYLKKNINNQISFIAQTRLVTNGSKFSDLNNQPINSEKFIGVHNGIFTNFDQQDLKKTINYESYDLKSDTLVFFSKLSKLADLGQFQNEYFKFIKNINGNYSLSFFKKDENKIYLSSNCGSLYYYFDNRFFTFASEKSFLTTFCNESLIYNSKIQVNKINQCINQTIIFDINTQELKVLQNLNEEKLSKNHISENIPIITNSDDDSLRLKKLQKCRKCILPETYPYINFNDQGICNYCANYEKQTYLGEEKLNNFLNQFRSNNGNVDCIVGLSGGRDSTYGLHLLKKKYKMNPIAYTYDWGLTTDISRINAAKVCGKLGIEHIIRSADIEKKREYVKLNLFAWLKRPHLGMLPIIQAGDKGFYDYGRKLSKELNIKLVVHCTGYQLEQREFFLGFAGINQKLKNNQRMSSYSNLNKFKMLCWYSWQFLLNPSYLNKALPDNFNGFLASFVRTDDFLHLYNYEQWNEAIIKKLLKEEYEWQDDISYGKNQWRMGDGQTAFNNFVYHTLAGFSEYDNFRSNQIREGLITREEAINLCQEDNKIKYDTLKNFSEVIGFNLDNVLSKISSIDKLY